MEEHNHRIILQRIAQKAMNERGFETAFPDSVLAESDQLTIPHLNEQALVKDLRHLIWCSIDNEDTKDIDQLSWAEQLPGNKVRVLIAIADVDALVGAQSNIDNHAGKNTVTVYTVAQIFPMLPERLSTDLTSLSYNNDRYAIVVEMIVDENGSVQQSDVYCAMVRNYAKLDYDSLATWLEGNGPIPDAIPIVDGLAENIRLQEKTARKMNERRFEHGALTFETIESRPVFEGDILTEMKGNLKNTAKSLIEDFMIAANGITAQYLAGKGYPSLRRVVDAPRRWDRMVEIASEHGYKLPEEADPKALSECMLYVKQNIPEKYVDFSFSVVKLMNGGEYVVEMPGESPQGHFGLAVKNYSHSTAPNRRYPDIITHRLLKSAMAGFNVPYSEEQLDAIAKRCTTREDDAKKVERTVEKSACAMLMESRIGEVFEGIISGAAPKGTWIRLYNPHLEGKLVKGFEGLQIGHKIKARLIAIDIEAGFIDFEKID